MRTIPTVCKRTVSPNRMEDSAKPSVLLVRAGCEGRFSKFPEVLVQVAERSESKPILACNKGEVAKSADAQIPNGITGEVGEGPALATFRASVHYYSLSSDRLPQANNIGTTIRTKNLHP